MKNTLKTMLVIIAACLTTTIIQAQQDRPQGPPPIPNDEQIEEMVKDLAEAVSLTDDQTEKVSELYFDHFEKVADQQENSKEDRNKGREAMEKLNAELEENVKAILEEDQVKLYTSWLTEQKKNRGNRGGRRAPRQ